MDHQQQQHMKQTEKIIIEMLEFLDSSSEEEDISDIEITKTEICEREIVKKDINDNLIQQTNKNFTKTKNFKKKTKKITTTIADELNKLKTNYPIWKTKEIDVATKNSINSNLKSPADNLGTKTDTHTITSDNLENNFRRSSCNLFSQEIQKAIYQDTTGHPPSGSVDYYQAAQNYALYGKHFSDFPDNWQTLLNDKNSQNMIATDGSNFIANYGQYSKSNVSPTNFLQPPNVATPTLSSAAASAAAYYQLCNQAQGRPALPNNISNSTAYGIFLGNKVTYIAATPTSATPPLIYNQHSTTTTTNFISNSLANAALATSPAILYTNPMLTTTTQQYLNTFFKETQYLSTALTTGNSTQSPMVPTASAGLYERLIYAQMLQQQLYQTQQAAAVAAMFQHKQRVAVAAAAATRQVNSINNNRTSSPQQHLNSVSTTTTSSNLNGSTFGTACNRSAKSTSPMELTSTKTQTSKATVITVNGNGESLKTTND